MQDHKKLRKLQKTYQNFLKKREKIIKANPFDYFYFTYNKLKLSHPNYCPLFKNNKICHNIDKDEMDCYHCYCPYYDNEYVENDRIGRCKRRRNNGKYNNNIWDCSDCTVMHKG
jgi:hypothetical protein